MRPSLLALVLLLPAATGCGETVVLGEVSGDGDGDVDSDVDAVGDADTATDADGDQPGDAAAPLTCEEVLGCMRACASDLGCALDCAERVCGASAEAFDALEACGLESCPEACTNLGSATCADCVAASCALEGYGCVSAGC